MRVRAEEVLFLIGVYTVHKWGLAQTDRYSSKLVECFQPGL